MRPVDIASLAVVLLLVGFAIYCVLRAAGRADDEARAIEERLAMIAASTDRGAQADHSDQDRKE